MAESAASGFASEADTGYVTEDDHAPLGPRLIAYALDSVVLFGFACAFAAAAFIIILLNTDSGYENPGDSTVWASVIVLMLTLPAWLAASLALVWKRGQTIGQYVMGLRVVGEDGETPTFRRLLLYWVALHPLLYHPVFAGFWALFAWVTITIAESTPLFLAAGTIAALSVVAPLLGIGVALSDPQRRALHDRLANMKVVWLD